MTTQQLEVSVRDAQFLTGLVAWFSAVQARDMGAVAHNLDMCLEAFQELYSPMEANALALRLHDMLPADGQVEVRLDPRFTQGLN